MEEVPKSLNGFATDVGPLLGKDMLVKSPLPPKGSVEGAPEMLNPPEDPNGSFVDEILPLKGSDDVADTGRPLLVSVDDGEAVPNEIDAKSALKSCAVERDGGGWDPEEEPNGSLELVLPPNGSNESFTTGAEDDDEPLSNKSSSSNEAAGCGGGCGCFLCPLEALSTLGVDPEEANGS